MNRKQFYGMHALLTSFPSLLFFIFLIVSGKSTGVLAFTGGCFFLCFFGSFLLLRYWEKKMQHAVAYLVEKKFEQFQDPTDLKMYKTEIERLQTEIVLARQVASPQIAQLEAEILLQKQELEHFQQESHKRAEEMRHAFHEFEAVKKEYLRVQEENGRLKEYAHEESEHHEALTMELRKSVHDQKMALEKKQRYIAKLEGKVRDLMYEIRSLLQLELPQEEESVEIREEVGSQPVSFDATSLLQRYAELAHSLTQLSYAEGKTSRFMDLTSHTFAIDQRRLFDALNEETHGIIFLFSQVEMKFVFANRSVKNLLGWSPEKFMKEFPQLVLEGYSEWREALGKIHGLREIKMRMQVQNKWESSCVFECVMKMLTSGPFSFHIMGILLPLPS